MRLTLPEIDLKDGFTPQNDIFSRVKLAHKIEKIISNLDGGNLVFGLDDNWGDGKTTFLKMWESKVKGEGNFNFLYFDAFENDYHDDPFLQISSMLYDSIGADNTELKSRFLETATKVGRSVLSIGAKLGIHYASSGLISGTIVEDGKDVIEGAMNEHIDNYIKDKISKSENEKRSIVKFKETLTEISKDKKIIFVIDELDRAKPSYSLDLIERVKHIFSEANVFFILSMNKTQFEKMIIKRYGDIDSQAYLNKFIHLWFSLPNISDHENNSLKVETYLKHLQSKISLPHKHNNHSIDPLMFLSKHHGLSLREMQRCFTQLFLLHTCLDGSVSNEDYAAMSILSYISIMENSLIRKIKLKQINREDLILKLTKVNVNNYVPMNTNRHITTIIRCINNELYTTEEFQRESEADSVLILKSHWNEQIKPLNNAIKLLDDLPISIPK